MRTTREQRTYRPSSFALEARNAVSSLLVGLPKPEALVQVLGDRESEAPAPASRKLVLVDSLADHSLSDRGDQPVPSDAPIVISQAAPSGSVLPTGPVIAVGLDRSGDLSAMTTVISTFGIGTESIPEKADAPDGLRQGGASQPAASQPVGAGQSAPSMPSSGAGAIQPLTSSSMPSSGVGAIRPLTLAPSQTAAAIANAPIATHSSETTLNTLSGGSGGNTNPVINYDGSYTGPFTDVIGGQGSVFVTAPSGSGLTIDTITWSIGGVVYGSQDAPDKADGQFVNHAVPAYQFNWSGFNFYWGEQSLGPIPIEVEVTYVGQAVPRSSTITVNVSLPSIDLDYSWYNPGLDIYDVNTPLGIQKHLRFGDPDEANNNPGMSWIVGLNSGSGSLNVVQRLLVLSSERRKTVGGVQYVEKAGVIRNPDGTISTPRPLLDDTMGSPTVFYGNPNHDSPGVILETAWPVTVYHAKFNDTVMYKPSGGIWVPTVYWTWEVNGWASWGGSQWSSGNYSAPVVSPIYSGASWPMWADSASNYQAYVQTSP